jgi:hypothetical protein
MNKITLSVVLISISLLSACGNTKKEPTEYEKIATMTQDLAKAKATAASLAHKEKIKNVRISFLPTAKFSVSNNGGRDAVYYDYVKWDFNMHNMYNRFEGGYLSYKDMTSHAQANFREVCQKMSRNPEQNCPITE